MPLPEDVWELSLWTSSPAVDDPLLEAAMGGCAHARTATGAYAPTRSRARTQECVHATRRADARARAYCELMLEEVPEGVRSSIALASRSCAKRERARMRVCDAHGHGHPHANA